MLDNKISLIVPVYNRADVLLDTVDSVLKQSYSNWELLLVDDGSTDSSRELLKELGTSDPKIKPYYREDFSEKKGAPACRNIGLKNASGNFVIFLDSDDIIKPDCLQERIDSYIKYPNMDFLVFPGAFFKNSILDSDRLWNKFTAEDDLYRFLRGDVVWQTTGPIWNRAFLIKNNLQFDEDARSSQDWEFHIHVLLTAPTYLKIEGSPDYYVRRDENAGQRISGNHNSLDKFRNRIELIEKILQSISRIDHLQALHKYLVRDTTSCLRMNASKTVVSMFRDVNELFPKTVKRNWLLFIKLSYLSLKQSNDLYYRLIARIIDQLYPGYFRGFKMNYRSKY